jgi:hypothetical protein
MSVLAAAYPICLELLATEMTRPLLSLGFSSKLLVRWEGNHQALDRAISLLIILFKHLINFLLPIINIFFTE